MKDRVIICKYYQWKGKCTKRKDGMADMNGYCQKCRAYVKDRKRLNSPVKVSKKRILLRKLEEKNSMREDL